MKSNQFLKEGFVEDANEVHADHEVQMARSDLFHAAEDALILHKLLRNVSEQQGLEGWVASKITLAADYLNTVREYMEYQLMSGAVSSPNQLAIAENKLKEFAPYGGDDGGGDDEEEILFKYAKMWYNSPYERQDQIEQILARMGWEIGEIETEEGGAFVIQPGDEHGKSYIGFSAADLTKGMSENKGSQGNFAGDKKVDVGGTSMKKIQVGDTVRYFGEKAQVVGLSHANNYARISADGKTLNVRLSDLKPLGQGGLDLATLRAAAKTAKPANQGMAEASLEEVSLGLAKRARDKAEYAVDMDYDDMRDRPEGYSEKQRSKFQRYIDKKEKRAKGDRDWDPPKQDVAEGMPASVIQAKEKIRRASDEENKKRFAGKTKEKLAQMARRHGYGDKNPYAKFHDGITEDADFGMNYAEKLAQKVFDARPDLDNEDAVLNAGYRIAVQDLDSKTRANHLFSLDADFASDFVSAYGYLKRQAIDEDDSDEAIAAFLARGGEIKKGKYRDPRKSEKTDYGSKHIGGMRDALAGKAGKTLGRAAKTNFAGASAKPVVTVETTAGSVAGVVNPTPKNKAKVGSLFGGTYKQKSTK